jgi:hypothetical protein
MWSHFNAAAVIFGSLMDIDLFPGDEKLRAEADDLLDRRGLRRVLEEFAPVSIVGSCALRLMVWRDLDVAMHAPGMSVADFFDLGKRVADLLGPWKMFFTNSRNHVSPSDPIGLYWGIRLGDISRGAWKIDVWAFDSDQFREKLRECDDLKARLNDENRRTILRLKSQLWNHPQYRNSITSQDIYDGVLEHGVTTLESFWEYVGRNGA